MVDAKVEMRNGNLYLVFKDEDEAEDYFQNHLDKWITENDIEYAFACFGGFMNAIRIGKHIS